MTLNPCYQSFTTQKVNIRACLNNRYQSHFWLFVRKVFHAFVVVYYLSVAPLGLRCMGFVTFLHTFRISIALTIRSLDLLWGF